MKVEFKKHCGNMPDLVQFPEGDCIDLCMCSANVPFRYDADGKQYVEVRKGDRLFVSFGLSVKLPEGYSMRVYPRSSTFKKYGLLLSNSVGVIDNAYNGDEDVIGGLFYCTEDAVIYKFDRLCQFEIVKRQPQLNIKYVSSLNGKNRGGYGSTGN